MIDGFGLDVGAVVTVGTGLSVDLGSGVGVGFSVGMGVGAGVGFGITHFPPAPKLRSSSCSFAVI